MTTSKRGGWPRLSATQARSIAQGMNTRGDVIEHVRGEAQDLNLPGHGSSFDARVRTITTAMGARDKPKKKALSEKGLLEALLKALQEPKAKAKAKAKVRQVRAPRKRRRKPRKPSAP